MSDVVAEIRKAYAAYRNDKGNQELLGRLVDLYTSTTHKGILKKLSKSEYSAISGLVHRYRKDEYTKEGTSLPAAIAKTSKKPVLQSVVNLSYRKEKFKIRRLLVQKALTLDTITVRALTLPGSEWLFERDLLLTGKCGKIVGLENNSTVFEYSKENMPLSDKVEVRLIQDSDYFNSYGPKDKFNFVWLDYMSPFTMARLSTIASMFEHRFLQDEGILALTFIRGLDAAIFQNYREVERISEKDVPRGKYKPNRAQVIPKIIQNVVERHGYLLNVLDVQEYKEEQGGCLTSPMLLVVFSFTKKTIEGKRGLSSGQVYNLLKKGKEDELKQAGFTTQEIAGYKAALSRAKNQATKVA